MYSHLFMHMRKILFAQEGWNSVNASTQPYIAARYAGGAVFVIVKNGYFDETIRQDFN